MNEGDYLAIWLFESGAKLFLGLQDSDKQDTEKPCRWVGVGFFKSYESHIGIWVQLDKLEQWAPSGDKVLWAVTPQVCMIRWEFIIYLQKFSERTTDTKSIGFKVTGKDKA